jgi:hypothetical protein
MCSTAEQNEGQALRWMPLACNPSILITHDLPLEDGVRAYDISRTSPTAVSGLRCGPELQVGG